MKTIDLTGVNNTKIPHALLSQFDLLTGGDGFEVIGANDLSTEISEIASMRPDELVWASLESGPGRWKYKVERIKKWDSKKGTCCGCGCG